MMVQPEPSEVSVSTQEIEPEQEEVIPDESTQHQEADAEPELEDEIEEPFVSAAEMFIQADKDDDGALSPEELAEAAGISIEESQELHESADKDGDGEMSLSEFVASPAVEKVASNLPRPVAPVRKPVNRTESTNQQALPSQNLAPRPIPHKMLHHNQLLETSRLIRYHSQCLSNKCGINLYNQQSGLELTAEVVASVSTHTGDFVQFVALKI